MDLLVWALDLLLLLEEDGCRPGEVVLPGIGPAMHDGDVAVVRGHGEAELAGRGGAAAASVEAGHQGREGVEVGEGGGEQHIAEGAEEEVDVGEGVVCAPC